ncbi:MAG: type II secretion system F family protein [Parcubacteria group bacterium]|nr:type II secretion system F family protein [Parcubacteria group bacterium]
MNFNYQARTPQGEIQTGTVEAPNQDAAAEALHRHGLVVLEVVEEKKGLDLGAELPFFNRIKNQDIVIFSRQLSVLFDAQVPLVPALRTLAEQAASPALRRIIADMAADVDAGTPFSMALEKFPKAFSHFYVSVVRAGEASGRLQDVLNYLADHEEKSYDLSRKIKGALTYPIFVISAVIVVGAVVMIFVIPNLTKILEESGQQLPFLTRIVIGISDFLRGYWWLALLVLGGLGGVAWYYTRTVSGKALWDKIKLKLPIFGGLFKKVYLARFAENLSTLIKGGIPIIQSLTITADVVGNVLYQDIILRAREEVRKGNTMSSVLSTEKAVPAMVAQMIRIGEQTGKLDMILVKIASFYGKEVDEMVGSMTELIQPILILILGAGAGILVAAILLPIYNLGSSL